MSIIAHQFKRLISTRYREETRRKDRHRRLQRAIEDYLDALPQCHGWVLLASRADAEQGFHCDVTVRTRDLLAWSNQRADQCIVQSFGSEVVSKALPRWLGQASFDDRTVSLLPPGGFCEIAGEINAWASQGLARVYCPQCRKAFSQIAAAEENVGEAGNALRWWTDVWTCPAGHVLREKDQYIRLIRSRHRS